MALRGEEEEETTTKRERKREERGGGGGVGDREDDECDPERDGESLLSLHRDEHNRFRSEMHGYPRVKERRESQYRPLGEGG